MKTFEDYQKVLDRNYGTQVYHSNLFDNKFYYTDGIEDFAETMEAFWVIDMVESHCKTVREFCNENDMESETLFIDLNVNDNKAEFAIKGYTFDDDDEDEEEVEKTIAHQSISFTDLPNGKYEFFLGRQGEDELVFFLTSEY